MIKEFREFIIKGNALDLAIGVIIGAAFGAVINSLVTDIITPIIAAIFQAPDFSNIFILLREGTTPGPYETYQAAIDAGAAAIGIGTFINLVINLIIVGFALFLVVKAANRLRRPEPEAAPAGPTTEEKLVTVLEKLEKKL
ncbi:MAG: large conductance mechanosensitive channel protein MscL [Anaerolineae bacterium]|nr:large conductance mechanosensitive channel protein MscL [Anaerolineae bacterium]